MQTDFVLTLGAHWNFSPVRLIKASHLIHSTNWTFCWAPGPHRRVIGWQPEAPLGYKPLVMNSKTTDKVAVAVQEGAIELLSPSQPQIPSIAFDAVMFWCAQWVGSTSRSHSLVQVEEGVLAKNMKFCHWHCWTIRQLYITTGSNSPIDHIRSQPYFTLQRLQSVMKHFFFLPQPAMLYISI